MNPILIIGLIALIILALFAFALVATAKYADECEDEIIARKWEERTAPDGTKYLWPVDDEEGEA